MYPGDEPGRHRNLIICSLATFPENFMQIRSVVFAQIKLLTDKQRRKHILLGGGNA